MNDFQTLDLGRILQTAAALKQAQQQSQSDALRQKVMEIQLTNAQGQQAQSDAVDQLTQSNPNATLADYAKAGGLQGVEASGKVSAARAADLLQQNRALYTAANSVANASDPIAAAQQHAPQIVQQYEAQNGPGSFAKLPPDQIKQQATDIAQHALLGLVDPDKQFAAQQQMIEAHYKQQGPGGEAERAKASIAATSANSRYVQGQENSRADKRLAAESVRAGFRADGTLDPKFDSTVQAILDYRAAPFSGASMRSGPGASIMAEVNRQDPTYDATQYPAKAAALKSLMSGPDGRTLDSVNTAVQHLAQLKGLLAALNSGDIGIINQAKQAFQAATGSAAPTDARVVANMAAGEVNKVVTGGPGAEGDRDISRAATQLTGSPEQQTGAMDNIIGLLAGRLKGTQNRFQQAKLGPTFDRMLLPETKAALASHAGGGAPPPANASVATPPANIQALLDKYK